MKSFYNNTLFNLLVVVLISFTSVFSQDAIDSVAVQKGEQIFKANCTSCHVMGETKLIGPGLKGVTDRRKKEWLKKWINSSSDFIASGDPDAIAIYEEYDKVAMTSYYFEDDDFESLYAYLQNPPVKKEVVAGDVILAQEDGMKTSSKLMCIALFLLLLVYVLISLKNKLKESLDQDTETIPETLINQYYDEQWLPLLQTPPFPEYTSGHSVISRAAAVTLTDLFGDNFSFTDTTEVAYGLGQRKYNSFIHASEEAAISRFYGGIHYMMAVSYTHLTLPTNREV